MTDLHHQLQGLWLPLITPFRDGELDVSSLRRLVRHYAGGPVDGFILGATSGEGMALSRDELEGLVSVVLAELSASSRHLPVCLGLSGASTAGMKEALDDTADWPINGYLIASPYYTRPSQRGLVRHFNALADHAAWPIERIQEDWEAFRAATRDVMTLVRRRILREERDLFPRASWPGADGR